MIKNKIIDYDDRFIFCFVESEEEKGLSPVSGYYTKLDDLSVNLLISLKWIKWGYVFLKSLSENLDSLEDSYKLKNIISKSVQKIDDIDEKEKIITIDNALIKNEKDFMSILENQYNHEILGKAFEKNTKIQMKLKINIREYIIITNLLYPTLIKVVNI